MSDVVNKWSSAVVAFIGAAGLPNRYGGFEAFLEHCAPEVLKHASAVYVTCDAGLYEDKNPVYKGVNRVFLRTPANGAYSVLHDLLAFLSVYRQATHIVVLGVSGGLWFPLFRFLCDLSGKKLAVNVDGVEWQRGKFSLFKRILLRAFDASAQIFSHKIIYDNPALERFLFSYCRGKAACIAYSGDHVLRVPNVAKEPGTALTICRIEPENNIEMLIQGALASDLKEYVIVGNWGKSAFGRQLRDKYASFKKLVFLDPVYDPVKLAELRERCEYYLHGHSVGGTNPSLVEMVFYDCRLLCFDVPYHRETCGEIAGYFRNSAELTKRLGELKSHDNADRAVRRLKMTKDFISRAYLEVVCGK